MKDLINYINSISPITQETISVLNNLFEKRVVEKNVFLVKNKQIAREIFFLEEGIIRTFIAKKSGIEYNKALDIPPTITCGYASIITGKPSSVNLQTLTKCVLWVASYTVFSDLYDTHPDLERAARIAAENAFVEKENRELEMAMLNATDRYELFKIKFQNMEQLISQYHIASYLGVSPTQLSRIRSSLRMKR